MGWERIWGWVVGKVRTCWAHIKLSTCTQRITEEEGAPAVADVVAWFYCVTKTTRGIHLADVGIWLGKRFRALSTPFRRRRDCCRFEVNSVKFLFFPYLHWQQTRRWMRTRRGKTWHKFGGGRMTGWMGCSNSSLRNIFMLNWFRPSTDFNSQSFPLPVGVIWIIVNMLWRIFSDWQGGDMTYGEVRKRDFSSWDSEL